MKKHAILITVLLISISACNMIYLGQEDWNYITSCDYAPKDFDDLQNWINNEIIFIYDTEQYGIDDYWATPKETLESKMGDCEDKAILFGYIAYQTFGLSPHFLWIYNSNSILCDWHMVVEFDEFPGEYWLEVESGQPWSIYKNYNYGQIMWIAENTHGEGILGK